MCPSVSIWDRYTSHFHACDWSEWSCPAAQGLYTAHVCSLHPVEHLYRAFLPCPVIATRIHCTVSPHAPSGAGRRGFATLCSVWARIHCTVFPHAPREAGRRGLATLCSVWGENTLYSDSHMDILYPEEQVDGVLLPCAVFEREYTVQYFTLGHSAP